MIITGFLIFLFTITASTDLFSQDKVLEAFLSGPAMAHASVSISVKDAVNGMPVMEYNSQESLKPASVMKLITSAAALELLGPGHTFSTVVGYTGKFNRRSGRLEGDIVIRGGGDPALGSVRFGIHYGDFLGRWTEALTNMGIKKITGRVTTDDTYFDYLPVPSKWLWEDTGNYYGAGAFGLSVYDNTYEIHLNTSSDTSVPLITGIVPEECRVEFDNWLVAAGITDEGYVFAAPYSTNGWLAGTVPGHMADFVLKASIPDPPALVAEITDKKLREKGIKIKGMPTTTRLQHIFTGEEITPVITIVSPPLNDIVEFINHESVNLYAEHLLKELGKVFLNKGTTASGIEILTQFLNDSGVNTGGMFIEDGSGLSQANAIKAEGIVNLLIYMKSRGKYFTEFYSSLPEAGQERTINKYFRDPVFDSKLRIKSGSMTRVRSFAGYFTTHSGKEMAFCVIVNNFTGTPQGVIASIETLVKQIILNR